MKSENQTMLASGLLVLAGAWLMLSPVFISMAGAALTSTLIAGGAIILAGLVQLFFRENPLPSWFEAAVAVYVFASAFLFTMSDAAIINLVATAAVTLVLATWDGIEAQHVYREHHGQFSPR